MLEGKTQTHVPELHAGDLGAVAKLKDTHTGDMLGDKAPAFTVPADRRSPSRCSRTRSQPKSRGDEDKISTSMHRLQEEDPSIGYTRDAQTHDLLLSGQGQLHIEVTVAKLRRRFGVEVNAQAAAHPVSGDDHRRASRRTAVTRSRPAATASSATARSGWSRSPRGADFEFVDDIFGGVHPAAVRPGRRKGHPGRAAARATSPAIPVVDLRVTVFDGSYHDVDSNELSFKMAGRLAFRDAMSRARPTLLEPIMTVEVYAPSDFAGDLMGDLNGRRGRIAGMDTRGTATVIRATVPMAEMLTYEQTLTVARPADAAPTTWSSRTTTRCRPTCTRRSSRRRRPSGAR